MSIYLADNFVAADGTLLQAHASDSGATWAKHPSSSNDATIVSDKVNPGGFSVYDASALTFGGIIATATIYADAYGGSSAIYLACDIDPSATTYYLGGYNAVRNASVYKFLTGSATNNDTLIELENNTNPNNLIHQVSLRRVIASGGSAVITTFVDGNPVCKYIDASPLTSTGRIGIWGSGTWSLGTLSAVSGITTPAKKLVVCNGDSLTEGFQCSSGQNTTSGTCYPGVLQSLLGSTWEASNLGIAGRSAQNIAADGTNRVGPLLSDPDATETWEVLLAGFNDGNQGADAPTIFTALQTNINDITGLGNKVIVCSLPHVGPGAVGYPPNVNDVFDAVNASIHANYPTSNVKVADLAANAFLNDPLNVTYRSSDQIHFVDPGYALLAQVVRAQLPTPSNPAILPCFLGRFGMFSGILASAAAAVSLYFRPDGTSKYLRPDGTSLYQRP